MKSAKNSNSKKASAKPKSSGGVKVYFKGGRIETVSDDDVISGLKDGKYKIAKQTFRYGGMVKALQNRNKKNG